MKKIFSLAVIALLGLSLLIGCTDADKSKSETSATQSSDPTPAEKQHIEKEITGLSKAFFQQVDKLDIEACMRFFENTPDFWAVNPDGTYADYNALKKINADGFSQMASFNNAIKKESIRILSKTQVLYTFFSTQEMILRTGEKMRLDNIAGTMLFEKINGAWKATFYQESAGTPVKADTK